jgi:tRNA(fMet)-specific endonuclease VapC
LTRHSSSVLVDTSIVIEHLRSAEPVIPRTSVRLYVPAVVISELRYGAERARKRHRLLMLLNEFMAATTLLPADETTAEHYGHLRAELAGNRIVIPENLIWIAATARQHDLPVATRDHRFRNIEGLSVLSW